MQLFPPADLRLGERGLDLVPPLAPDVPDRWNRRLRYWSGRTLTADALSLESQHRTSSLALAAQRLQHGIVAGLGATVEQGPTPPRPESCAPSAFLSNWYVRLQPGLGIAPGGEDVAVPRALLVAIDHLPVVGQAPPASGSLDLTCPRGLGILVLQPIEILQDRNSAAAEPAVCPDPGDDAFVDRVRTDGARLAWFPWPKSMRAPSAGDPRFRNLLATRIFAREAARTSDRDWFPWEAAGLPIALVHVDGHGNVTFCDRAAVARSGGMRRLSAPLVAGSGTTALWQARVRQFADHLADLARAGIAITDAEAYFQSLPPVGLLPSAFVDLAGNRTDFFPASVRMRAVPVPSEQFEAVLDACAALAPVDLDAGGEVMLYVPVPQKVYDPRLLYPETVAQSFLDAVDTVTGQVADRLARRAALRRQAGFVEGARDLALVPTWPVPDPDQAPGEPAPAATTDEADLGEKSRTRLDTLATTINDDYPFMKDEWNQVVGLAAWKTAVAAGQKPAFTGLRNWITDLDQRIRAADDAVNFGFLRVQTDMYRVRQLMLGSTAASRLATSPALAAIAKGDSAAASTRQIGDFFQANFSQASPKLFMRSLSPLAKDAGGAALPPEAEKTRTSLDFRDLEVSSAGNARFLFKDVVAAPGKRGFSAVFNGGAVKDIVGRNPLIGKILDVRTTTIADRLEQPPAPEAKDGSVASKLAIISGLLGLRLNLDGLMIPIASPDAAIFPKAEFDAFLAGVGTDGRVAEVLQARTQRNARWVSVFLGRLTTADRAALGSRLFELQARTSVRLPLSTPRLAEDLLSGIFDPDPSDGDEASFFGGAVTAQELAISALRLVEGRIQAYRAGLDELNQALTDLDVVADAWTARLGTVDHELAETRHDLTVARALLAEEQARVAAVTARRKKIIAEHVKVVGFARARTQDPQEDAPDTDLLPEYIDPIPACASGTHAVPDGLDEMLDTFRHAPVGWLPDLRKLLQYLDRTEDLQAALAKAKLAASIRGTVPLPGIMLYAGTGGQRIADGLSQVIGAYRTWRTTTWARKAALDIGRFTRLSWRDAERQAADELSLDDLAGSSGLRGQLAQQAGTAIARIEGVAACFHTRLSRVPAEARLAWAERISVFDRPIPLRSLAVLPRWDQVDPVARRDLQHFVDWLFARVDTAVDEATGLMNDLVRVAILVACHAPVNGIIAGHLPKAVSSRVGELIDLAVERGTARIGMEVHLVVSGAITARAVVEDLAGASARVRLTHSATTTVTLAAGTQARFLARR